MPQNIEPNQVQAYFTACWRKMHDESATDAERATAAKAVKSAVLPKRPKN